MVRRQSRASCKSVAGVSGGYSQARTSKAPETGRSRNLLGSTPKSIRRVSEGYPKGMPRLLGQKKDEVRYPSEPRPQPNSTLPYVPHPRSVTLCEEIYCPAAGHGCGTCWGTFAPASPARAGAYQVSTTRLQFLKSENRRPKSEGNPNFEARSTSHHGPAAARCGKAGFGLRVSVFLRILGRSDRWC